MHWRFIDKQRPDVTVLIVDLVRGNLLHASELLGANLINKNIHLIHGNACQIAIDSGCIDVVWSVQTTQHIPDQFAVVNEVLRLLKPGGLYIDYGLNSSALFKGIYRIFRRNYHEIGDFKGQFYLRRMNATTIKSITEIFGVDAEIRYTELLFTPGLNSFLRASQGSIIGKLDYFLGGPGFFRKLFARQCNVKIKKALVAEGG